MPDPRQMSGVPLPSRDLPDGVISVRLIRAQLANNIRNHQVELHGGDELLRARTGEDGRAQFRGVTPGTQVHAVAVVGGERLESQRFRVPASGGVRLMLVASDGASSASTEVPERPATDQPAARSPSSGGGVCGAHSRIVLDLLEDAGPGA
jgi:hypothetical protein